MKLKEGKISSGDLARSLGISPQALSYHLNKLKKADIIYETKYKNCKEHPCSFFIMTLSLIKGISNTL